MGVLEKLLEPVSEEDRAGPDLDEDAEGIRSAFAADFKYASGLTERADDSQDGKSVNWSEIKSEIEDLSFKSKDLRLAIAYARCGIALGDVDVVDCGLAFIVGLFEDYWDVFHPCDEDGPDLIYRGTCCQELVKLGEFALPFLKVPFVQEGRVQINGEQICDVHENGAASQDHAVVMGVLTGWDSESKSGLLVKLASIVASFEKIQNIFSERDAANAPNFDDVISCVRDVRASYVSLAGLDVVEEGVDDSEEEIATDGGPVKSFSGKIQSRDDVVKALTEIENYYNLAEPGHPVKVALARMRSWVKKDFMEILQDIVPNSVDDAKRVLMETQENDD